MLSIAIYRTKVQLGIIRRDSIGMHFGNGQEHGIILYISANTTPQMISPVYLRRKDWVSSQSRERTELPNHLRRCLYIIDGGKKNDTT